MQQEILFLSILFVHVRIRVRVVTSSNIYFSGYYASRLSQLHARGPQILGDLVVDLGCANPPHVETLYKQVSMWWPLHIAVMENIFVVLQNICKGPSRGVKISEHNKIFVCHKTFIVFEITKWKHRVNKKN